MEATRLFDILPFQHARYSQEVALATRKGDKWVPVSTSDCIELITQISKSLVAADVQPGDRVGLVSENCLKWTLTDQAIQQVGGITVPVYPNSSLSDYTHIFQEAETRLIFVSNPALYAKVKEASKGMAVDPKVVLFTGGEKAISWNIFLKNGEKIGDTEIEKRKASITPNDVATIIYTSGSTGVPKGVMLTHYNILSNLKATLTILPVSHFSETISFLPWCHIFERTVLYTYFYSGASVYIVEDLNQIEQSLKEVRPHYFTTVPRLLEKIYERMLFYGYSLKGLRKFIFFWSLRLARKYQIDARLSLGFRIKLAIARKLVYSKLVTSTGGRLKGILTGAAALPVKLCKVFSAAGIPVREGYGQTEASPVLTLNRFEPGGAREGTVGLPIPGVEIRIAHNGEILAKGPNIMKGYYKRDAETAATIDKEGWLHTGDVGELVEGRFLKITGRIKELFKTSGGKYVAPQPLETLLSESSLVHTCMVVGENRKFPAALIVPDIPNLQQWVTQAGIPGDTVRAWLIHPEVRKKFEEEINTVNQSYARHAQIKSFILLPEVWAVETGELTPNLKLKRKNILEKYTPQIDTMYAVSQGV